MSTSTPKDDKVHQGSIFNIVCNTDILKLNKCTSKQLYRTKAQCVKEASDYLKCYIDTHDKLMNQFQT